MREILFRGQYQGCKKWHEGDYLTANMIKGIATKTLEVYPVKPETVGEYIQRTDKRGKKVFEGDLVALTIKYDNGDENHDIFEVQYDDDGCRFVLLALEPKYQDISPVFTQSFFSKHMEVIGNRWDNPELLGVRHGK